MTTPVYITGFEYGANPTTNGNGLWNTVVGSPVVDSSIKRSGGYSLKVVGPGSSACSVRKVLGGSSQIAVGSFYFYVPTGGVPSSSTILFGFITANAGGMSGLRITSDGKVQAQLTGSGSSVGNTDLVLDTWHRFDLRLNLTATNWVLEWYLDGVQQTNAELPGQLTNDSVDAFRFGSTSSSSAYTVYFDDVVFSLTNADYPIGDLAVELLSPTADGTHNAGTNIIEDQAGNDIGVVTAYNKINSVPTDSSEYIKQVANDSGNYAEVQFGNIQAGHSSIIGAVGILSYTSQTATANNGACVVSKDGFSTKTPIWGDTSSPADYSDGSTSNPFWKSAIIDGVIDTSTVNALTGRLGYSTDTSPNPYWLDLVVEVAYVPSSGTDIDLDLVTYATTINDVSILENVVESLDLVTYSGLFNDISVLENVLELLDLASYSLSYNDLDVVENVSELLDLVSYSNLFNDVSILENVIESLDLAVYSVTFNDTDILENIVEFLDLVSYSSLINDIDLLEEGVENLDLVTYINTFNDVVLLENDIVDLDLVSYSSIIYDVDFMEEGDLLLDLVSYSNVFNSILFVSQDEPTIVSIGRVYSICYSDRICSIDRPRKVLFIERQNRIF